MSLTVKAMSTPASVFIQVLDVPVSVRGFAAMSFSTLPSTL
jgi:hypothetical protein